MHEILGGSIMNNVQNTTRTSNKVWIDGNTLVRRVGEDEAREYLHGNGYQAKLTAFIKARDAKLKEEEKLRKAKLTKSAEVEPGL